MRSTAKVLIGRKLYEIKRLDTKLLYNVLIERRSQTNNKMESLYSREFCIDNMKPTWKKVYEKKLVGVKAATPR